MWEERVVLKGVKDKENVIRRNLVLLRVVVLRGVCEVDLGNIC